MVGQECPTYVSDLVGQECPTDIKYLGIHCENGFVYRCGQVTRDNLFLT